MALLGEDDLGPYWAIRGSDRIELESGSALAVVDVLERAVDELNEELGGIKGTLVEDKRFSVVVHYRNVTLESFESLPDGRLSNYGRTSIGTRATHWTGSLARSMDRP